MSNGVVHVGAHKGEEVRVYQAQNRWPIVCFEPQRFDTPGWWRFKLYQIALADFIGWITLRIPHHLHETSERDTMSASGLPLIAENAIANGWTPTPCDLIEVPVERFDHWAPLAGFQRGSCSLLVIDVQGMELQVLQGFGEYLDDFHELKVECSTPPLYAGGASAEEVVDFLKKHGFCQDSPIMRHGDIHFTKEKSMNQSAVDALHAEYYESGVWARTFWRGHRIERFPTDLMAYQEILYELKPDLIVETGTRFGGSAVFLGDMCQLLGHGQVVSIDIHADCAPPHDRVTYVTGDSSDPAIAAQATPAGTVLVILDSDHHRNHVLKEMDLWAPFVSPGSYLIVEDTNLNGHPIDKQGQPGPWEAVEEWLSNHPEFARDRSREKFLFTANPGGYLKKADL